MGAGDWNGNASAGNFLYSGKFALEKILLTCKDDNYGSIAVIEKNGGGGAGQNRKCGRWKKETDKKILDCFREKQPLGVTEISEKDAAQAL